MTYYAILKRGKLQLTYGHLPYITRVYKHAKNSNCAVHGEIVEVEIVIRTPQRRAISALTERKKMTMNKATKNLAKEFAYAEAESKKAAPKKVVKKGKVKSKGKC